MIETSQSTAALDEAMAKAQSQIQTAAKDKINPAFRSRYADLASVWEACRDALTSNGVFISQWPVHSEDNRLHIVTRLAFKGEWIKAHFSIPVLKQDAHGYGSSLTYAKRMSLAACVGVVADDDDDGNAASNKPAMPSVNGTPGASKAGSRAAYDAFVKAIRSAATIKALADWHKENVTEIDKLPQDWVEQLREEYVDRQSELKKALAA